MRTTASNLAFRARVILVRLPRRLDDELDDAVDELERRVTQLVGRVLWQLALDCAPRVASDGRVGHARDGRTGAVRVGSARLLLAARHEIHYRFTGRTDSDTV